MSPPTIYTKLSHITYIHITILSKGMKRKCSTTTSPPWEVIALVSDHVDPQTAYIESCVSNSWNNVMSFGFLWKSICRSHYPSLAKLTVGDMWVLKMVYATCNIFLSDYHAPKEKSLSWTTTLKNVWSRTKSLLILLLILITFPVLLLLLFVF